ncbi:TetR/AcrR family transcriptional regulator [Fictibacillus sp. KU28468]|uniref:TetR/AcrR family transcriptional regulator n=1 Tax=Fictibacillus sp. KU28468 TaxID=2991053 RepID=UPI0008EF96B6|nr:TetR/AcrR family transcriptional regulator [Fictibacillus sp. KU28468]UZJ79861.1 TetR/AcrR family transcriptional regulator [Fictibacillus sp. KU28468]SFD45930.1 transcriptional regulator, TetR family [Bacillus sp. OV194]
MKQRKVEIIESAIALFAEKGFHSTSIQDITDHAGMSKGAFYNYFSSKEELMIALFHYYNDKISQKISEIGEQNLPPRETIKKQMVALFTSFTEHKNFIIMHFREQNSTINEEMRKHMLKTQYKSLRWLEKNLLSLYGEDITPHLGDLILIAQGLQNTYIRIFIFDDQLLQPEALAEFLLQRLDDIVAGLQKTKATMISIKNLENLFSRLHLHTEQSLQDTIHQKLLNMGKTLDKLPLPAEKRDELKSVIEFLLSENEKTDPNKMVFQGMLANLKGVKELENDRKDIARIMGIELL